MNGEAWVNPFSTNLLMASRHEIPRKNVKKISHFHSKLVDISNEYVVEHHCMVKIAVFLNATQFVPPLNVCKSSHRKADFIDIGKPNAILSELIQ